MSGVIDVQQWEPTVSVNPISNISLAPVVIAILTVVFIVIVVVRSISIVTVTPFCSGHLWASTTSGRSCRPQDDLDYTQRVLPPIGQVTFRV
jgi:hypothetical protein